MENRTSKVTKLVPVPCSEKPKPPPSSDCLALQYGCTECCHQGEKENDVINRIQNKHKAISSPAQVGTLVPSPRKKHQHIFPANQLDCLMCSYRNIFDPYVTRLIEDILQKHGRLSMQNYLVKQKQRITIKFSDTHKCRICS